MCMAKERWHTLVEDDDVLSGVRQEMARTSSTRTAVVLELLREALHMRRVRRDQEAWSLYLAKQRDAHDHAHGVDYSDVDVLASAHMEKEKEGEDAHG